MRWDSSARMRFLSHSRSSMKPCGAGPRAEPYALWGRRSTGKLAGWICWGPTPCTLGTYDLYWMAVDPALQGSGIGTALVLKWSAGSPVWPG